MSAGHSSSTSHQQEGQKNYPLLDWLIPSNVNDLSAVHVSLAVGLVTILWLCYRSLIRRRPSQRQPRNRPDGQSTASRTRKSPFASSSGQQEERQWNTRWPAHVAPSSVAKSKRSSTSTTTTPGSGSGLLGSDGVVAFAHSRASVAEQGLDAETLAANRQDRARVLSRLVTSNAAAKSSAAPHRPPAKGSNVVVSLPLADVQLGCEKLRRVLYLLGTYYNLFVLVAIDSESYKPENDRSAMMDQLRQTPLDPDVLPDHRIVACSTVAGRVAFCRQLGSSPRGVELVVDFDAEVLQLLSRFGHKAVVYGQEQGEQKGADRISMLGKELLC